MNLRLCILALCLLTAAAICLVLAPYVVEPYAGFLVNLSAGFVGTLLTVFLIDRLLAWNEQCRWEAVKLYGILKAKYAAIQSLQPALLSMGYYLDPRLASEERNEEYRANPLLITKFFEEKLFAQNKKADYDCGRRLTVLFDKLPELTHRFTLLVDMFGERLGPDSTECLLSFLWELDMMKTVCETSQRLLDNMQRHPERYEIWNSESLNQSHQISMERYLLALQAVFLATYGKNGAISQQFRCYALRG